MNLLDDKAVRHAHFIGAGGIGVSALAELLLKKGFRVSGSDIKDSDRLQYLRVLGADIYVGHKAENITSADMVVYSSAIHDDNPELLQATKDGLRLIKRGRLLADIMQFYQGVAITGTHGKTTTTALLAHLLICADVDPTYFIGGIPHDRESPVHIGQSNVFIAEADESDASFLFMQPSLAVVTNIECDHLSTYAGSEAELQQSFLHFLRHIPNGGAAVLCADDENLQQIMPQVKCKMLTYGVAADAHYQICDYQQVGLNATATLRTPDGERSLSLNLPGLHNMKNAVAAIIIARRLGVEWEIILSALKTFSGVGRRFQAHGTIHLEQKALALYEDYGHHPTEVRETYKAAKQAFPDQRVILVYQPHRYTRTRDLMSEFIEVLGQVDHLVLLPTYAAGEEAIDGATSEDLFRALDTAHYVTKNDLLPLLHKYVQADDVLLFQGAGDVGSFARRIKEDYA